MSRQRHFTNTNSMQTVLIQTDQNREVFDGLEVFDVDGPVLFARVPDAFDFLRKAFQHTALYRSVYRFFVVQHILDTFDLSVFSEQKLETLVLRMAIFPREKEKEIIDAIPLSIQLHPKTFSDFMSVVFVKGKYYVGLAPKEFFFYPENAVHSVEKLSSVSRAHFKLKEALERVHANLSPDGIAVDVGAAPGGISLFLADGMRKVYAIDPAELGVQRPNIVHLKLRAEAAVAEITEEIDLLNCDMNKKPDVCIDILKTFEPKLRVGGLICLTLKMPDKKLAKRTSAAVDYFRQVFPNLKVSRVMYLLANSNSERFLVAQKEGNASLPS